MTHASDLDTIAALLIRALALCGECIARTLSAPLWRVHHDLGELAKTLRVVTADGRCRDCEKPTVVHRLA